MNKQNALGQKLKELRQRTGLSQEDVAKHLHVTHQTVSAWENGKNSPDAQTIFSLCHLYGTTPNELYELTSFDKQELSNLASENQKIKATLEQVCLSAIAVFFCIFPYVGVIAPAVILVWMIIKRKTYPLAYILCVIALLVGLQNTYVIMGQILDIGHSTIEKIQ